MAGAPANTTASSPSTNCPAQLIQYKVGDAEEETLCKHAYFVHTSMTLFYTDFDENAPSISKS